MSNISNILATIKFENDFLFFKQCFLDQSKILLFCKEMSNILQYFSHNKLFVDNLYIQFGRLEFCCFVDNLYIQFGRLEFCCFVDNLYIQFGRLEFCCFVDNLYIQFGRLEFCCFVDNLYIQFGRLEFCKDLPFPKRQILDTS